MLQITISKRAALIIAIALLLVIPGIAGATHIFTDVTDGRRSHHFAMDGDGVGINTYDATSFNTVETGGDDEVSVYGKLVIEYFPYELDLIILPLDE